MIRSQARLLLIVLIQLVFVLLDLDIDFLTKFSSVIYMCECDALFKRVELSFIETIEPKHIFSFQCNIIPRA